MNTIIDVDGQTRLQDMLKADFVVRIFGDDFVYIKHRYDHNGSYDKVFPLKDLPAHIINNEDPPAIKFTKFDAVWGTYGKSGKEPLTFKRLIDLESDHLQAIARTQCISAEYRNIIVEILQDRKVLP